MTQSYRKETREIRATKEIKGEKGEQGEQGLQGIQGIKGDKGDDGYPFLIYKQYDTIEQFTPGDFPKIGLMFMVMTFIEDKGYPIYRYIAEGDTPYSLVTHMNSEGVKGEKGDKGDQGEQGIQGEPGENGKDGTTYTPKAGTVETVEHDRSAEVTASVNEETKEVAFNFKIPKGRDGNGLSAYELAVKGGYVGTEAEWLESLKGKDGADGKDAPQIDDENISEDTPYSSKKIDETFLKKNGDSSNTTVTFTEPEEETEPQSKDKLSVLVGKFVKKFKTLTGSIGDLTKLKTDEKTNIVGATNALYDSLVDIESELGELEKNVKFNVDDLNNAYVVNKTITVRTNRNTKNLPPSVITNFLVTSFAYVEGQYYRATQYCYENSENLSCAMYVRRGVSNSGESSITWSDWKELATMDKVVGKHTNDVSPTTFDANRSNFSNGSVTYMVINNMCHLTYSGLKPISTGNDITIGNVPKPCAQLFTTTTSDKGVSKGLIGVYSNGILAMNTDGSADSLYGSLVYEIAKP